MASMACSGGVKPVSISIMVFPPPFFANISQTRISEMSFST